VQAAALVPADSRGWQLGPAAARGRAEVVGRGLDSEAEARRVLAAVVDILAFRVLEFSTRAAAGPAGASLEGGTGLARGRAAARAPCRLVRAAEQARFRAGPAVERPRFRVGRAAARVPAGATLPAAVDPRPAIWATFSASAEAAFCPAGAAEESNVPAHDLGRTAGASSARALVPARMAAAFNVRARALEAMGVASPVGLAEVIVLAGAAIVPAAGSFRTVRAAAMVAPAVPEGMAMVGPAGLEGAATMVAQGVRATADGRVVPATAIAPRGLVKAAAERNGRTDDRRGTIGPAAGPGGSIGPFTPARVG
jgi:hypothetical protein